MDPNGRGGAAKAADRHRAWARRRKGPHGRVGGTVSTARADRERRLARLGHYLASATAWRAPGVRAGRRRPWQRASERASGRTDGTW